MLFLSPGYLSILNRVECIQYVEAPHVGFDTGRGGILRGQAVILHAVL